MRPQDDPGLRDLLQGEAERHAPDRDAMLARIESRRRGRPAGLRLASRIPVGPRARRTMGLLRPIAAAVAVAGVLVAGVAGFRLAGRPPTPPDDRVAATPASASPSPAGRPSPATRPSSPAVTPTRRPTGGPPPPSRTRKPTAPKSSLGPPAAITSAPAADGYLTAAGVRDRYSLPTWSQNDLTLGTTETITALDVTVRVALTAGVIDTGRWSTIPNDLLSSTVTGTRTELVYHFTLNAGATLAPGSYTLAVQYLHAGTRDVTADTYAVTATASRQAKLTGHFTG